MRFKIQKLFKNLSRPHLKNSPSPQVPRRPTASDSVERSENVSSSGVSSMPGSGFLIGGTTTAEQRFRPSFLSSSPSSSPHNRRQLFSPSPSLAPLNCDPESSSSYRTLTAEVRHKMEKRCNEKLNEQRLKYDQLLSELTSDLELLTNHMEAQDTATTTEPCSQPLEQTIHELEEQNDRLQKSLVSCEEQLQGSHSDLKEISLESTTLRRKVSDLECQLRNKENNFEELKCAEATLAAELKLQKQICKCHYETIESQDALSIRLQEMHQMLSEKSAEAVRNATALRWKNIELERMGKMAGEEKQRLRDEIEELMGTLSGCKNRVLELERTAEVKAMEVTKLNQRLQEADQTQNHLQDNLLRSMEQLSSLENQMFKWVAE